MTNLPAAIDSGQVSAEQIEAHHEAGELSIVMFEPMSAAWTPEMLREAKSRNRIEMQKPQTLREICDGVAGQKFGTVAVPVAMLRAALDDAGRYRSLVQIGVTETASIRERRNGCILWFGPSVESEPNGTAIYAAIKATS